MIEQMAPIQATMLIALYQIICSAKNTSRQSLSQASEGSEKLGEGHACGILSTKRKASR